MIEFLGNLKIGEHPLTRKTFSLKESSLKKRTIRFFLKEICAHYEKLSTKKVQITYNLLCYFYRKKKSHISQKCNRGQKLK